jgi:hypothetical protein
MQRKCTRIILYKGYDVLSSDRNYGLQLDNSGWSKYMAGAQFDQQLKAYADAQKAAAAAASAARAAASRRSSGGGSSKSGGSSTPKKTITIADPLIHHTQMLRKARLKPILRNTIRKPAVIAGQKTGSKYFSAPVSPSSTIQTLSAWEKMHSC